MWWNKDEEDFQVDPELQYGTPQTATMNPMSRRSSNPLYEVNPMQGGAPSMKPYSQAISEAYGTKPSTKDLIFNQLVNPTLGRMVAYAIGGRPGLRNVMDSQGEQAKLDQEQAAYRQRMLENDPVNRRAFWEASQKQGPNFNMSFANSIGEQFHRSDLKDFNTPEEQYLYQNPNASADQYADKFAEYAGKKSKAEWGAAMPYRLQLQDERMDNQLDMLGRRLQSQSDNLERRLSAQAEENAKKREAQAAEKARSNYYQTTTHKLPDGTKVVIKDALPEDFEQAEGFGPWLSEKMGQQRGSKFNYQKYLQRKAKEAPPLGSQGSESQPGVAPQSRFGSNTPSGTNFNF